jgi:YegS/Rv2252/BmrU family lipid kinase
MSTPRTVLVVNPESQSGALGRNWYEYARIIRREMGSFEEVRTEGPGDATRLAREALRAGAERVVAIGGDGTINETVNGFFEDGRPVAPEAELGILPFGTGGDFRKTVKVPRDLARASRILARGRTRRIDVGELEYTLREGGTERRIFINIASFGISGLVDRLVNQTSKRLGGRLSFLVATARASVSYQNQRVRLVLDDDEAGALDMTINTVAVSNGRYFGGGMRIAPRAELDDGLFDVVAIGDVGVMDMIVAGPRIYNGTHLELDKVSFRRAASVRAEPVGGDEVELDMDGETPGILPARFRLLPKALSLVVPA